MREETFSTYKLKITNVTGSRPTRERVRTMTNREFYEAIANGTINEEVMTKAAELIEKMDAANKARREKVTEKQAENLKLVEEVVAMLGAEPLTATDIAAALEVNPQKASALARMAVAAGRAASQDVKGPKGKCKGYTLA